MTSSIHIDSPGDGAWIMRRLGGLYNESNNHCVALHRDGEIKGGVVYTGYYGASIFCHVAGSGDNWPTRDWLWMIFDYPFNQLGCRKLVGFVPAKNTRAISVDLRLGFRLEGRLAGMLPDPDEDLLILTMRKEDCKYLKITPKHYRSGGSDHNDIKWVV